MSETKIKLWSPSAVQKVPDTLSDPKQITSHAIQLRERERVQITKNLEDGSNEVAASYVWMRTMALLKKQIALLGAGFVGELLQRPDIDDFSDVSTAVSENEAISLARDLGILTPLQTIRLLQSQAIVTHFASYENSLSSDEDELMTREEAISCLRVCVQGVLGHEQIGVAEDFKRFREKLESETLSLQSPEVFKLGSSPYFFIRTAVGILLSLFKTRKGAQLEHVARNALLIIPHVWPQLKAPERSQVGAAYALEFSEGRKDVVKGLYAVLLAVAGFDYVPENLRSTTFIQVAARVIAAHQGLNNFYNEQAPLKELANLGTSIPSPAVPACVTAILCVKLGNAYGVSFSAQSLADHIISSLSGDRWTYYFNERLEQDSIILAKLILESPLLRWMSLILDLKPDLKAITSKNVKALLIATMSSDKSKMRTIAARMYNECMGL